MADLEKRADGDTSSTSGIKRAIVKTIEQTNKRTRNNSDYDHTTDTGDDANKPGTIGPHRAEEKNDESEEDWCAYPVQPLSMSSEPASPTSPTISTSQVCFVPIPCSAFKMLTVTS